MAQTFYGIPACYLQNGFSDSGEEIPKQMNGLAFISWKAEKWWSGLGHLERVQVRIFYFTENTLA